MWLKNCKMSLTNYSKLFLAVCNIVGPHRLWLENFVEFLYVFLKVMFY